MSEIPPLRITTEDGSFNQIPVFHLELSGGVLTKKSPTKVNLAISGSQGPSGPPGASGFSVPLITNSGGTGLTTIGSAHTLLGVNSSEASLTYYAITGSNDVSVIKAGTLITVSAKTQNISGKQDSISFPISIGSGGTALTSTGSSFTLLGTESGGSTLTYFILSGSNSTSIVKSGTSITFSTITSPIIDTSSLVQNTRTISTTYPLSGGGNLSADKTFFIQTGALGQVLVTSGGVTGDLAWVNTLGGASGVVYAATGNAYIVTDLASDLTNEFRLVQSGNSISIDTTGKLIIVNATTQNITSKQDSINFPLSIGSGGTALNASGSAHTLLGVNSSEASLSYYLISGSNNTSVFYAHTSIIVSTITGTGIDTSSLVQNTRTVSASSGLTGGGDLTSDRFFSVNTNIRDKQYVFFGAGNIIAGKNFEKALIYAPFNAQVLGIYSSVQYPGSGSTVDLTVVQYPNPTGSAVVIGSTVISDSASSASNTTTFTTGTIYTGSWIGVLVSKSGSVIAGSNLTINLLTRTS